MPGQYVAADAENRLGILRQAGRGVVVVVPVAGAAGFELFGAFIVRRPGDPKPDGQTFNLKQARATVEVRFVGDMRLKAQTKRLSLDARLLRAGARPG